MNRWLYYRDKKRGVSKWVMGVRHWVTKFDKQPACVIGFNGSRVEPADPIQEPAKARQWVEERL